MNTLENNETECIVTYAFSDVLPTDCKIKIMLQNPPLQQALDAAPNTPTAPLGLGLSSSPQDLLSLPALSPSPIFDTIQDGVVLIAGTQHAALAPREDCAQ